VDHRTGTILIEEADMETGRIINIVATGCHPDDEAKFNKWYDEIHIPMLLKFDGMLGVIRYRLCGGGEGQAKYLAVYEFKNQAAMDGFQKSAELAAAREEMSETWKGRAFEIKWRAQYEPLKTWKK
jgi:antibiotic biosynthesis monooxygenase (ABM) superfamily enzyme